MLTASWEPSRIVPVQPTQCPQFVPAIMTLLRCWLSSPSCQGPDGASLGTCQKFPFPQVQPAIGSAHAVLTCSVTLGLTSLSWSLKMSSVIQFTCNPGASSLVL